MKIDYKAAVRVPITGFFLRDFLAAKVGFNREAIKAGISAQEQWLLTIVETRLVLGVF